MGAWTQKQTPRKKTNIAPIIDDRFPISDQHCYAIGSPSNDGLWGARDVAICVPYEAYRSRPLPGDWLIAESTRDDLGQYTLWRCQIVNGKTEIKLVIGVDGTVPPNSSAKGPQWVGLVISRVTPLI